LSGVGPRLLPQHAYPRAFATLLPATTVRAAFDLPILRQHSLSHGLVCRCAQSLPCTRTTPLPTRSTAASITPNEPDYRGRYHHKHAPPHHHVGSEHTVYSHTWFYTTTTPHTYRSCRTRSGSTLVGCAAFEHDWFPPDPFRLPSCCPATVVQLFCIVGTVPDVPLLHCHLSHTLCPCDCANLHTCGCAPMWNNNNVI